MYSSAVGVVGTVRVERGDDEGVREWMWGCNLSGGQIGWR